MEFSITMIVGGSAGQDTISIREGDLADPTSTLYLELEEHDFGSGNVAVNFEDTFSSIVVYGQGGDDSIKVNDQIGPIPVALYGGAGADDLDGGISDDLLVGGAGNDELDGDEGDDLLVGGHGRDYLVGKLGDDFLNGGLGGDFLDGGEGNDVVLSSEGNDVFNGDVEIEPSEITDDLVLSKKSSEPNLLFDLRNIGTIFSKKSGFVIRSLNNVI